MSAYFDHPGVEAIRSEDIYNLFKRANKRSSEFIRIELTDEKKRLSRPDKTQPLEFVILEATLIFRRADGRMERYDFTPDTHDTAFMAAIQPRMFMVYLIQTPGQTLEGRMMFEKPETFLGLFKTATSTIFITYDGEMDNFGYAFSLEYQGYPSVYDLMRAALDTKWGYTV